MDKTEMLLEKGYFPSQLPPSFTSRQLASNLAALQLAWKVGDKGVKAPSCKPELFSVARVGHQRRVTSITNPVAQTFLSACVAKYWDELLVHYQKSNLSVSRPSFDSESSRAASIPSMQTLHEQKILESAGYKFMLRTDISRFFPTIYTHSVPWALHTKPLAKKYRQKLTDKYFGNLLDQALRQGQDEQTMGLPIGPDTSHVIAEAIATSVDQILRSSLKSWPAGFRYVDDYFLFFPTVAEAEGALAALSKALKDFELQINFEKTFIRPVSEIVDDYWTHQLHSFAIEKKARKQKTDLHHFFELAKNLAAKNKDENVMTYALKRAASVLIKPENWEIFEAHICHVAMSHPNTLQTVAQILWTYKFYSYELNQPRIQRTLNALIAEHCALGHHSEVAWSLWMCKELEISLDQENIDLVASIPSSVCALLLMDLATSGKLLSNPKETFWKTVNGPDSMQEELWLMCYEAGLRGWAGFDDAYISADSHFKDLKALNISFYDQNAKSKLMFTVRSNLLEEFGLDNWIDFFKMDVASDYLEYGEIDDGYEGVVVEDFEDISEVFKEKNKDAGQGEPYTTVYF